MSHIVRACKDDRELILLVNEYPHTGLLDTLRNEIYSKYSARLVISSVEDMKRCLVGVVGENMSEVAVGLVEDVRLEENDIIIKLRTPYNGPIKA